MDLLHICVLLVSLYSVFGSVAIYDKTNHHIRMNLQMDFHAIYTDKESKNSSVINFSLDKHDTVTFPNASASEQFVNVAMNRKDATEADDLTFTFYYDADLLVMNVTYVFNPPEDAENKSAITSKLSLPLSVKKKSGHSFFCQLPATHKFTQESDDKQHELQLSTTISQARIQAFGLNKEHGFGKGDECKADAKDVQAWYDLSDKANACLNLTVAMHIDIPYNLTVGSKHENGNTRVVFPQGSVSKTDKCVSSGVQNLTIEYYDKFTFTFVFNKTSDSDKKIYLSDMQLAYTIEDNDTFFPNAAKAEKTHHTLKLSGQDSGLYTFSSGDYFKCLHDMSYELKDGATDGKLSMENFRFVVYSDGKKPASLEGKNYEQCPQDVHVSNVVPIAVGAALGALVIIVLIAYLIGRRKTHKGYESV